LVRGGTPSEAIAGAQSPELMITFEASNGQSGSSTTSGVLRLVSVVAIDDRFIMEIIADERPQSPPP
jgi:hypothetical protein